MGYPYGGAAGVVVDTLQVDKAKFRSWAAAVERNVIAEYDDVAAMIADASLTYTAGGSLQSVQTGDLIFARRAGVFYEVAASGASGHHVTKADGIKLYEAGPVFTTRARMAAAVTRGIENGAILRCDGIDHVVDSTATGARSVLQDLGVDGLRRAVTVDNAYIAAFFQDTSAAPIMFYSSVDGEVFKRLNADAIEHGTTGQVLNSRDPFLMWHNGEFWISVTNYSVGAWDAVIYRSPDLITWKRHQVTFGSSALTDAVNPVTGGSQPADLLWAPKLFRDTDGTLYCFFAVRYGNDFNDTYSVSTKHKRIFVAQCTDEDAMTFASPVQVNFGADTQAMIDAHVVKVGSTYWMAVKGENTKRIRFYSASAITGAWAFDQELTGTHKIEAPILARHRRYNAGVLEEIWRCYVDAYADTSGNEVGQTYYFEADTLGGTWGSEARCKTSSSVRHGGIINLAAIDPAALEVMKNAVTSFAGEIRQDIAREEALVAGAVTLYPQEGVVYYIAGSGQVATVTLADGAAESFYLASLSAGNGTGIVVAAGAWCASQVMIGFGFSSDRYVRMVRKEDGKYYAEGNQPRAYFRANKNGTAQNVTVDTETLVTFDTEDRDIGSHYDTGTSRWTPPAGRYRVRSQMIFSNAVASNNNLLILKKNGTAIAQATAYTTSGNMFLAVDEIVEADGDDYFEVFVDFNGSGTKTITGAAINTYFEGGPL
ncbi:family 43 glycosylhydrolase [Defluviimonas sp. SAOS-178_SWC]|uniref:family 43 glycosylhydrolase n=1 Tax=Defluviimonas sp. SAOS-178_SWC TaxID=3121287 RepID=UPI0032221ED0